MNQLEIIAQIIVEQIRPIIPPNYTTKIIGDTKQEIFRLIEINKPNYGTIVLIQITTEIVVYPTDITDSIAIDYSEPNLLDIIAQIVNTACAQQPP